MRSSASEHGYKDRGLRTMETALTVFVSQQSPNGLRALSLTQLEGTLVAANLLLDVWREVASSNFSQSSKMSRIPPPSSSVNIRPKFGSTASSRVSKGSDNKASVGQTQIEVIQCSRY
jgi:hypothetical protein